MSDGRRRVVDDYTMVKTQGNVVHAVGTRPLGLACLGRFSHLTTEPVYPPAVVSCLWCISGMVDSRMRWFKWADDT